MTEREIRVSMIDISTFCQFALSLPETDEAPHFDSVAFRVKKKIFATLNVQQQRATVKFSPETQEVFTAISLSYRLAWAFILKTTLL